MYIHTSKILEIDFTLFNFSGHPWETVSDSDPFYCGRKLHIKGPRFPTKTGNFDCEFSRKNS